MSKETKAQRHARSVREYYSRNREKVKSRSRKWSAEHPEYRSEYNRNYSKEHRDRINERKRAYCQLPHCKATRRAWEKRNLENIRKWRKDFQDRNPEYRSMYDAIRRARVRNAMRGCQKRVRRIYRRCAELKKWFDVCVDHVIPLAFGGAHSANNLQIIYQYENFKKRSNPFYQPSIIFS